MRGPCLCKCPTGLTGRQSDSLPTWREITDPDSPTVELDPSPLIANQSGQLARTTPGPHPLVCPCTNWTGSKIAQYRILARIGEGGMGVVYRAEDTRLHRPVALKFLRPEALVCEESKTRLLREAEAAAALDHPNVCTVYDIGEHDGVAFVAMAYIDGDSLAARLEKGPLKLDEVLDIVVQVARGIRAAHRQGIVHRDIKSANVMLDGEGRAQIVDFGLARSWRHERIAICRMITGTPAYMSPEQLNGDVADHRTDLWSLGVLAYELTAGRPPFEGSSLQAVIAAIQNQEPTPLTALRLNVPVEWNSIVIKSLAKDLARRYQSADEVLADIGGLRPQETWVACSGSAAPARYFRRVLPAARRVIHRGRACIRRHPRQIGLFDCRIS